MPYPLTRICTMCKQEKSLEDDFSVLTKGTYGRQSACRPCMRLRHKSYRAVPKNKAKHKTYRDCPLGKWKAYRKDAERRGLVFEFTLERFTELFWQKTCSYCGDTIRTAGVDRLDNKEGYTEVNAVPCCYICNLMKLKSSREDFIAKCRKIALYNG